ncbi:N utilization substance protein B [Buchnera aphidicola str. Bp (Baizongia pistaciae)]|uniref:Transcription antitermination protein NusB n=1 Tax=Buchnera aphidicola subsp. Baizongia pistaciae (strain Bp) TaxID=224915 RepID=NUSB_BUCBP|nr:transcription antitermination factor NusB [Buchnera aphidicola]P59452.1 RecName: Full=Transcription antitermination protein NusB; AltName: Full=Antitermination factor NusB [Buchnera aphidicola str. Bp (Baizongia pistaciae)]AAO27120.1 N utilization substance protein B [Buchnera aphidicola str. Bp (Baizongia pistaciae)]
MKSKTKTRRKAREYAVQALYSWQISKNDIYDVINHFKKNKTINEIDQIYFYELIIGITKNLKYLDELMRPYLSRTIQELGQIEKAILRISFFELDKRYDIPFKVTINESIELAKLFGAKDSHKFINGVLDKASLKLRKNNSNKN